MSECFAPLFVPLVGSGPDPPEFVLLEFELLELEFEFEFPPLLPFPFPLLAPRPPLLPLPLPLQPPRATADTWGSAD